MTTPSQKVYTAYKVELNDPTAVTTQIAAHISGLTSGHEGAVERLEVSKEGNNLVGVLIMSDYVPLDTSIIFIGSGKTGALNSGSATLSFIAPFNGKVVTGYSRVSADPGTGGATLTLKVNGGTAATATIVHASGDAANSLKTATFADNNVVVAGDKIELVSTNTATNAVTAIAGVLMQKTA